MCGCGFPPVFHNALQVIQNLVGGCAQQPCKTSKEMYSVDCCIVAYVCVCLWGANGLYQYVCVCSVSNFCNPCLGKLAGNVAEGVAPVHVCGCRVSHLCNLEFVGVHNSLARRNVYQHVDQYMRVWLLHLRNQSINQSISYITWLYNNKVM